MTPEEFKSWHLEKYKKPAQIFNRSGAAGPEDGRYTYEIVGGDSLVIKAEGYANIERESLQKAIDNFLAIDADKPKLIALNDAKEAARYLLRVLNWQTPNETQLPLEEIARTIRAWAAQSKVF